MKTKDGRKIGEVDGFMVDTGQRKVRYLETKVDKDVLGADDDRWMLLPVGRARLDDEHDVVDLAVDASELRTMSLSHHQQREKPGAKDRTR